MRQYQRIVIVIADAFRIGADSHDGSKVFEWHHLQRYLVGQRWKGYDESGKEVEVDVDATST